MQRQRENYLPSPREIRAICGEIQRGWSERERRHRAVHGAGMIHWIVPQANLRQVRRAVTEE